MEQNEDNKIRSVTYEWGKNVESTLEELERDNREYREKIHKLEMAQQVGVERCKSVETAKADKGDLAQLRTQWKTAMVAVTVGLALLTIILELLRFVIN